MDDVMFSYDEVNGPESSTTLCLEEFARWQYYIWTWDNYGAKSSLCGCHWSFALWRIEATCYRPIRAKQWYGLTSCPTDSTRLQHEFVVTRLVRGYELVCQHWYPATSLLHATTAWQ